MNQALGLGDSEGVKMKESELTYEEKREQLPQHKFCKFDETGFARIGPPVMNAPDIDRETCGGILRPRPEGV